MSPELLLLSSGNAANFQFSLRSATSSKGTLSPRATGPSPKALAPTPIASNLSSLASPSRRGRITLGGRRRSSLTSRPTRDAIEEVYVELREPREQPRSPRRSRDTRTRVVYDAVVSVSRFADACADVSRTLEADTPRVSNPSLKTRAFLLQRRINLAEVGTSLRHLSGPNQLDRIERTGPIRI